MGSSKQVLTLYTQHHGWLFDWLRRKLGDRNDAADLAQETFVRLIASRRSEGALGPEPRALLTHIARGLVIDRWRRRDVERAYIDALQYLPAQYQQSAEERMLLLETLTQISAALAALPPRTTTMFLAAQLDGLTLQQISDQMEIPMITVRRHIRTALLACMAAA